MESSPVASEHEEGQYGVDWFASGLSSEGSPIVEVVMPRTGSPATTKRARASISNAIDRAKLARCLVGSPALRLINQMAMSSQLQMTGSPAVRSPSTVLRSSTPATTRNSCELSQQCFMMDDLPDALLSEIIKRLTRTSDLNSLSLVSKRLYNIEGELRDAVHLGCDLFPVTLAVTSLCSRFPNLSKVEFNYSGWKPEHGIQLDNQGLRVLSSCCHSLSDLTLSFCSFIDDSGLSLLACFKKLMSLRFNTLPKITSCGLLSVAVGCKSLSSLYLIHCNKVSNVEWLEYLGRTRSLEELVVFNCERIRQFDLQRLGAGWMKLRKFELQIRGLPDILFDPDDPSYVSHNQYRYDFCCETLKDLTLVRLTTVPEIGLHCLLSKCVALEKLCLSCITGIKDNDMVTLAHNCSNLRSISLLLRPEYCEGYAYRTALTDDTLKALALRCPMLQSVELAFFGCLPEWPEIGFTQDGLITLIQSCPIHELVLRRANIFDDEGMKALSCAQFMESLKLVQIIAITNAGMRHLACSPSLMNLTLELCDGITDDGVGEVVRRRKLDSLTIEKCAKVSQEAVNGAAKSVQYTDDCPSFKRWVDCCLYGNKYCDHLA